MWDDFGLKAATGKGSGAWLASGRTPWSAQRSEAPRANLRSAGPASCARPLGRGVRAYAPSGLASVVLAKALPYETRKRHNLVRAFAVLCARLRQKIIYLRMQS